MIKNNGRDYDIRSSYLHLWNCLDSVFSSVTKLNSLFIGYKPSSVSYCYLQFFCISLFYVSLFIHIYRIYTFIRYDKFLKINVFVLFSTWEAWIHISVSFLSKNFLFFNIFLCTYGMSFRQIICNTITISWDKSW